MDTTDIPGNITVKTVMLWCGCLCICLVAAALSFKYVDVPLARFLAPDATKLEHLASGLAGAILVSGEAAVVLLLILLRHIHGKLPKIAHVLAIACIASICAYAFNSAVLKWMFGVPNPTHVLAGAQHAFHFFQGSKDSSFPSGHMMLAGGFGGVFMYCYPRSRIFLSALLIFGMGLLVAGNWHFLSDVITGTFFGVTAGLMAGEIWMLHEAE